MCSIPASQFFGGQKMKCRPMLAVNFNKVLQEASVHGTCAAVESHFQFRRLMEHHIVGTLSKIHPHCRRFWASFISCSSSARSLASHSLFFFVFCLSFLPVGEKPFNWLTRATWERVKTFTPSKCLDNIEKRPMKSTFFLDSQRHSEAFH